jgi:hypothetical protein
MLALSRHGIDAVYHVSTTDPDLNASKQNKDKCVQTPVAEYELFRLT